MESSVYNTGEVLQTYGDVFGLTNSLAMFQAMMNELLRDLINTGKVAVFIDDVIIRTKMEGHEKLVAELLKDWRRMIYM